METFCTELRVYQEITFVKCFSLPELICYTLSVSGKYLCSEYFLFYGEVLMLYPSYLNLCQSPPVRHRRLVITSGLHRNSAYLCRRTALASRSEALGAVDKYPVLIQSCRTRSVLSVTFLAPTKSACSVYPQAGF